MTAEDWAVPYARAVMALLSGDGVGSGAPRDTPLALCINAWSEDLPFSVPRLPGATWTVVLDTADPYAAPRAVDAGGADHRVRARAVVVASGEAL